MVGKSSTKCAKCGVTSKEEPTLTFHRFPQVSTKHGSLRVKVWAKYCFPEGDWNSEELLKKLHAQHKMICGKHFDETSFTSSDRKKLHQFSIPTEAFNILSQLRAEPGPSQQENMISSVPPPPPHVPPNKVSHGTSSGILNEIELTKVQELTPRKQKLYKRCRRNLSEIMRLRRKLKNTKQTRRCLLKTLTSNDAIDSILKCKLSSSFYLLLQSQMKNVPRKLAGRRWSLDDKVLALSIYKKSSSCYRLLRRLFCLPSTSSLKKLLNEIPMTCGVNKTMVKSIKEISQKRDISENLAILAFDEMSIRKNLSYNCKQDQIDGFQDHNEQGRTSAIATHALTFMAIGVRKPWKQPIAYYFSGDSVTADRLAVLIKEVISACFDAGLEIIGTVCDLDGVNIRAINSLGSSTDRPYFDHDGHEIVTILDPPHLLKCFRNNFLKHNIEFTHDIQINGKQTQGIAKWSHIEDFFTLDKNNPNFVFAPALTQQHLQPNGKHKMKVRLAAQVFSHSVAAGLYAKVGKNELNQDAASTATVVAKMDKLFDAMNGDTADRKKGKEFLTRMSPRSGHLDFFKKMKSFLRNMKFVGARKKPPCQEGWVRSINGIERMYLNLKNNFNIASLSTKRINQDPLENCFGCIRGNCGSNPNPTTTQFVAALKTSIISNLINNNKNKNCIDDDNDVLDNLKSYIIKNKDKEICSTQTEAMDIDRMENDLIPEPESNTTIPSGEIEACAYVCGFIAKNMNISCTMCKNILLSDPGSESFHLFSSFKEYNDDKNSLKYVTQEFCQMVENAASSINIYLEANAHKNNIKLNINKMCQNLNTDWLRACEEHFSTNVDNIIKSTICICVKRFCTVKNREFIEDASKKSWKRKLDILSNI